MSEPVLSCDGVGKSYRVGAETVRVLADVSFAVVPGETVSFQGVSGSGKSTLLHIVGGLLRPDSGQVAIDGEPYGSMSDRDLCAVRNRKLGFVYQSHHLMGEFTAAENAAMPLWIRGEGGPGASARARAILGQVGLGDCADKTPGMLSGGERQRVAIARALAGGPRCVIADEPTGNLDRENAERVFGLLVRLCEQDGVALVTATHDSRLAGRCTHRFEIVSGSLEQVA